MKSKTIWFVSKRYGWGWTPSTWQGWAITLSYVLYEVILSSLIGTAFNDRPGITTFLFLTLLGTILLLIVCYKYGETPRWRWGK